MTWSPSLLLGAAVFVRLCAAQESGWLSGQVNATMCQWDSPRAAVIRDTLYIDGGYLWWLPGLSDGTYGGPVADGNPLGLVYLLNFSTPFNTSQNLSSIFTTISKASGGGSANNVGPQYYDGAMFANDYEWFTYGGLLGLTDAYLPPAADSVAAYEVYASGPPKQFQPGYILDQLPDGITRYIAHGAPVSVPSENLGFYFGGLRSAEYGPIYYLPSNDSLNADIESTTLIELNMTVQQNELWNNYSLPASVPGRANAELVWVPVSKQGVLIAIGGVIYPSFDNINQVDNTSATDASEQISPGFMSTVSVYDITNKVWYKQPTSGGPGALTQGCTVVASAQDGSSHNIYWYGGYDGLNLQGDFNDDVWILSIPSFIWMKVKSGTSAHARAGHKCTKPYPDQMLVVGGYSSLSGTSLTCVEGGIIQIFNLSSAEWIDSYNPTVWSNYSVPSMIYQMIGGNEAGSATQTAPSPTGFANASMTALFGTAYNSSKIPKWYPYHPIQTSSNNRTNLPPPVVTVKSGTPAYLAPVLGVVLGLFFVTLIILAILLYRRRKLLRLNGTATQSDSGTMDNRRWVSNWIRATPADAKAPTVTTDETPTSPYEDDERAHMPEVGGTQVHEMMDTSRPVELHDTGFIPMGKGYLTTHNGLAPSPSVGSHNSQTSRSSTVSRDSHISGNRQPNSSVQRPGPGFPHLSQNREQTRVGSDVSGVSEAERGHLRGISETSVSTDENYATPTEHFGGAENTRVTPPEPASRPLAISPVSPPHAQSEDYLSGGSEARGIPTPNKSQMRSDFA